MQLVLSEDQELIAKTAADFVKEKSPVARLRELRDRRDPDGFSRTLWKEMAELGWVGIPFPESAGGAGLGLAELCVVMEALGRGLAPEPFLSTVLVGGGLLTLAGDESACDRWLPGVVAGETILALASQERDSRFDLCRVSTRAEVVDGGFALTGEKTQVLDGHVADALVVVARLAGEVRDRDGLGLFLVPRDAPGLEVVRQHRLDDRNAALVRLQGVRVPAEAALGTPGRGLELLEPAVDRATVGLCAEMLGGMQEAFDLTLAHLKSRRQFGVPIGSFQALKHRAADLFIEIELSKSVVMAAARAADAGDPELPRLVSLAKARCTDAYLHVANEAVQMFGGVGMTDEYDIGFYLKWARACQMTFGDAACHRDRWARQSGY